MSQSSANKTLRIVAKDIRHLWPEILLALATTAGFALTQHYTWPNYAASNLPGATALAGWMIFLMPLSWWMLVARAIHDEPLVGDRQFWITRPYAWPRVLGAKLILIVVFIVLPFLLAQVSLLLQVGLHPLRVVPGLLLLLGSCFVFALLPMMALAVITSNIGRMILVLLGTLFYAALFLYFANLFRGQHAWTPSVGEPLEAFFALLPIVCAVVVVVQYARRYTQLSVALLLGTVVILSIVSAIALKTSWAVIPYPVVGPREAAPVHLDLGPPTPSQAIVGIDSQAPREVLLPLAVSGVASGHAVMMVGREVDLDYPGGKLSTSWEPDFSGFLANGDVWRDRLPRGLPEPIPAHPEVTYPASVKGRLTYAVDEYEPFATTTLSAADTLDMPGNGHCSVDNLHGLDLSYLCFFAMHGPGVLRFQYTLRQTCGVHSPADRAFDHWDNLQRQPNFNAVEFTGTSLDAVVHTGPQQRLKLCQGEPIAVTRYRRIRQRLLTVDLPSFDPQPYLTPPPAFAPRTLDQ